MSLTNGPVINMGLLIRVNKNFTHSYRILDMFFIDNPILTAKITMRARMIVLLIPRQME